MAERIDAFGAHADAITQAEDTLRVAAAPRAAMWFADDGVVALAMGAALAGDFLEAINADQAFDENFHQFDEETEFLHRNNQRVVFLAETTFHELRSFPFHQFAFSRFGTAFGFGTFGSDFFELGAAV